MSKKIAFVFPGQGSQKMQMLSATAKKHATALNETFQEASDILGYDVRSLIMDNLDNKLNQTEFTQPILLTTSVALWRIHIRDNKDVIEPHFLAGHSLGEYSALVCANALDFHDALRLVRNRGKYMQACVQSIPSAMMAIIGLDEELIIATCQQIKEQKGAVIEPANYNSPAQTVIAGEKQVIEDSVTIFKELGAKKTVLLSVGVPSHCSLMKPAAENLAKDLEDITFSTPKIATVHNATASCCDSPEAIKALLVKQLYSPVRWIETIQYVHHLGAVHFFECGPGNVLSGLIKRITKSVKTYPMDTEDFEFTLRKYRE